MLTIDTAKHKLVYQTSLLDVKVTVRLRPTLAGVGFFISATKNNEYAASDFRWSQETAIRQADQFLLALTNAVPTLPASALP